MEDEDLWIWGVLKFPAGKKNGGKSIFFSPFFPRAFAFIHLISCYSAPASGAYPPAQTGYAVTPAAGAYGAQRTGYDQYQQPQAAQSYSE